MPSPALGPKHSEPTKRSSSPLTTPEGAQWRTSFWHNLRDFFAAPGRAPRAAAASAASTLSSVTTTAMWPAAGHLSRAQGISLAFHGTLIALLLIPATQQLRIAPPWPGEQLIFPVSRLQPVVTHRGNEPRGGGNSGNHQPEPPTAGKPTRFNWIQLAPPRLHPEVSARLQVEATVIGPPDIRLADLPFPNPGDPLRTLLNNSQGPGEEGSFGDKRGHGVGTGNRDGQGPGDDWGTGKPGRPQAGSLRDSEPVCVYCPNPTFSDEAVKTKFQGSVLLRFVVTADGKPANISVVRTPGMGLDEKAVEAVRRWRFEPARGPNHQPVAAWVTVEVMFRQF